MPRSTPKRELSRDADISVLIPDSQAKQRSKSSTDATAASRGNASAIVDGILAALPGAGAISIAGMGSVMGAGPIKSALAVGASTKANALVEGLTRFGISEQEAKQYESQLKSGNILVACLCENDDWLNRAEEAFRNSGAGQITTSTGVPADYMHAQQPNDSAHLRRHALKWFFAGPLRSPRSWREHVDRRSLSFAKGNLRDRASTPARVRR